MKLNYEKEIAKVIVSMSNVFVHKCKMADKNN